jgi:hypothetical protein
MSNITQAANRSSDFTSGSKSQDSVIVKRWGKNSFMDCTDKYDCVAECGMGTKACWKTCKGDPSVRKPVIYVPKATY